MAGEPYLPYKRIIQRCFLSFYKKKWLKGQAKK
jgi:hypothetical protein